MKSIESIKMELESFKFDKGAPMQLAAIAEDIDASPEGAALIESVLGLFERFPLEDFGAPGPLTHAIERYYKRGYEPKLIASLERAPTPLTLWLAHRIINANDANAPRFREIIFRISQRTDLAQVLVDQARAYLSERPK